MALFSCLNIQSCLKGKLFSNTLRFLMNIYYVDIYLNLLENIRIRIRREEECLKNASTY